MVCQAFEIRSTCLDISLDESLVAQYLDKDQVHALQLWFQFMAKYSCVLEYLLGDGFVIQCRMTHVVTDKTGVKFYDG